MKILVLPLLLIASLAGRSAKAETPTASEDTFQSVAVALLPAHINASSAADLVTLYRLQLAARRFTDAEATLSRLAIAYQSSEPRKVPAIRPWQIYARAKTYEAAKVPASSALARAFAELYSALPDNQMQAVLPWFNANHAFLLAEESEKAKACAGTLLTSCPASAAAELIEAHEAVNAWGYLLPAAKPLLDADAARRFVIDDQVLVPLPNGSKIAALIVRPRGVTSAKLTALLNYTIYAREDWSMADAIQMAAHGYAGVVAYTRGKGRSPDQVTPYVNDGEDAAAVIQWLARQPWSDGRVGMFSGSYNGFTQWAALKHRPPALKAIATNATNAPGIDTPMQGNVFQSFIYAWPFYTTSVKGLDEAIYNDRDRWVALGKKWYASGRPYRDLDKIDGKPNPIFDRWLDHPDYDGYWQRLIPYGREFAMIDIPVFVQTGYYDGGMVGALYYLQQHYKYRPSASHRLLVGPYHHTAMQSGVLPRIDGYTVDKAALLDLQQIRLKWFDHVFHGAPLPEILSDKINFQIMGTNTWRHVPTIASMATSKQRFYLTGQRHDSRFLFGEAPGEAPPQLRIDFNDRNDVDFQPAPGTPDTRNALVFETQALDQPLEVAGLFHGRFEIIANKHDFDLSVNFYELRSDGQYLDLASYLGRVSYIQDRTHRQLLHPGRLQIIQFQSQTLTARLLGKGSRIVAVVGVPKTPFTQINYGTGRDVSAESISDAGEPLRIRWLPESYFTLGLRGAVNLAKDP